MARGPRAAEPQAPAAPHPKDVYVYERGEAVETAFVDALERGRLHHAWLLCGPEGVGKATFAYRVARRLLGGRHDPRYGLLGVAPEDPDARLIATGAHPDLTVLERESEDGRLKKSISVDAARALPEFFAKAPSRSAYRVAIVDAADDLNVNAANALLKTLEEPPERGVLLLVAHAPGRIMATIRSRCRRLTFHPWPEVAVADFVARRAEVDANAAARLAGMARGAPGKALSLAAGPALDFDDLARGLVFEDVAPSDAELQHLADGFRGAAGQGRFELLLDRLAEAVRTRAEGEAGQGGRVDRWAAFWEKLAALPGEADAINLDRADVLWSLLAELKTLKA